MNGKSYEHSTQFVGVIEQVLHRVLHYLHVSSTFNHPITLASQLSL